MKTHITAALALLSELHQVGHIRDEGNVKYQAAKSELEAALATPDPEPVVVDSPDVAVVKETLQEMKGQLEAIELHVATLAGAEATPA